MLKKMFFYSQNFKVFEDVKVLKIDQVCRKIGVFKVKVSEKNDFLSDS
jgi:hypothetical protein